MGSARIVTDSSADLSADVVEELDISVVPLRIETGPKTLVDSPDLRSSEFHSRMLEDKTTPTVLAPTPQQFVQVYRQLALETDEIVSIHLSSRFNGTARAANSGRGGLLGRCTISVIDSQLISRALGILVTEAALAAQSGARASDIVRLVRGLIPRTYLAFYVENLNSLGRSSPFPPPSGPGWGVRQSRPLLILEDGQITPVRRFHKRGTPLERLCEFVAEFQALKQLAILHSGLVREVDRLKEQLAELLPGQAIEEHIYGPVLESYIGARGLGVVVFEG